MLLLYYSFNNAAAGIRDYVASNGEKISERIWKEPVEAWPEAVFRHLFGGLRKTTMYLEIFGIRAKIQTGHIPNKRGKEYGLGLRCSVLPRNDQVNVNIRELP
jgi:hypothetical protein